jgi:catalase
MPKPPQPTTSPGSGGETHQSAETNEPASSDRALTNNQGLRIADNQNSLKSGVRGPVLLEDFLLREKIFHFDHERIPERVVHARGSGAHGFFETTAPLSDITTAALFQGSGTRTPVFVRFSTVLGSKGSVDTPRDVRGFAVKFYTSEGNWDLVGNNIPVFFIQDAQKFPDLIHAAKPEEDRGFPEAASAHDTFWDFVSLMPESTHMLLWAMSDRTLPRSLRMMEGFGVHTFEMISEDGTVSLVKFHWKPKLGVQSTLWDEALKIQAADNDFHRRDLWEAINAGDFPEWELGVQVFDQDLADELPYDVLDPTKLIPEEVVPVRIVGRMVLDRNPDNVFAETEQVAFCPTNIVPGIGFSNDPLLQGRLFSYLDTQKSRLGSTNFHQLSINAAKCPVMNFNRDGLMQTAVPKGRANYEPNSLHRQGDDGGPRECPVSGYLTPSRRPASGEQGGKMRARPERFADHYSQARMFWLSQSNSEQAHIASAFVFELSKVQNSDVQSRTLGLLRNVDDGLAQRVAAGLGVKLSKTAPAGVPHVDMPPSDALSIQKASEPKLTGRVVGILIADGSDATAVATLKVALTEAGARIKVIAPRIGGAKLSNGKTLPADGTLQTLPSQLLDAVAIVLSAEGCAELVDDAAAVEFVANAFVHLKAIGASADAQPLLEMANVVTDDGVTATGADFVAAAALRFWEREPKVRRLA